MCFGRRTISGWRRGHPGHRFGRPFQKQKSWQIKGIFQAHFTKPDSCLRVLAPDNYLFEFNHVDLQQLGATIASPSIYH